LLHEGVDGARIAVTGATVAESLHRFAETGPAEGPAPNGSAAAHAPSVPDIRPVSPRKARGKGSDITPHAAPHATPGVAARPLPEGRTVLVSLNGMHASPPALKDVCAAVRELALARRDTGFLVPVGSHRPLRDAAIPLLGAVPNVRLMPVPPLPEFVACLRAACLVLTDAADVLEQAAALGVPVLALRATPHLPEAVRAGRARLVGTDKAAILRETAALLDDPAHHATMATAMPRSASPWRWTGS
jgi:UDP-N-acetylglucosamine 2-epimerase (non-hydrolysing)